MRCKLLVSCKRAMEKAPPKSQGDPGSEGVLGARVSAGSGVGKVTRPHTIIACVGRTTFGRKISELKRRLQTREHTMGSLAATRIALLAHYLTDVLAGWSLASSSTGLSPQRSQNAARHEQAPWRSCLGRRPSLTVAAAGRRSAACCGR